jgi:hypothetical protein
LANKKTVAVQPAGEKDLAVVLSTTKTKKQNAPAKLGHKSDAKGFPQDGQGCEEPGTGNRK